MALSKSVNLEHAQTAVPCDACEDEAPGEYYCIECKHTLCPPCEKLHRKFTKGHNVVLRTQVGDIDITVLTCTDHGDQASFHCEKCNIPVCGKCITGQHKGHDLTGLNDIFERKKGSLQNHLTRMQQEVLPALEKRRDEILRLKGNYERQIEEVTNDIENENQAAHKELDRIHDDRMERISSIKKTHLSAFDGYRIEIEEKIQLMKRKISQHREVIEQNSLPLILINLTKQKESLPEIESNLELPQPPIFEPGSVQNLEESLGKVHLSLPSLISAWDISNLKILSQFKCPSQGQASICITKEGDVWLGGFDSRKLVMVDINGKVLLKRKLRNRASALAVLDCGDIIMSPHYSDSHSVRRIQGDDKDILVFDGSPSSCNGVSTTADQKILVCVEDGRVVKVNSDGTNVMQIYKGSCRGSAAHAIEDTECNIYISDVTNPGVVKISKDGEVLSRLTQTLEGQTLTWPLGLVVDKIGNILCADRKNKCIYIIDKRLQVRELLRCSDHTPRWLAIDKENNLWVAMREGIILVVKYLA